MRSLPENAKRLQPPAHTLRMPPVAVARDDELVPRAAPFVPCHRAAEGHGGVAYGIAVGLRRRRIAQRLMRKIAAVADEVPEQYDRVVRPRLRRCRLRNLAGQRDAGAGGDFRERSPSVAGQYAVPRGGTQ